MIIGIDASRANVEKKTGVERYAFRVIQELKTLIPPEFRVMLYSREPLLGPLADLPLNWESRVIPRPRRLWTQIGLSLEMLRRPPDLLFVPAHMLPLVLPRRSAITLHDAGFSAVPEAYSLQGRLYHQLMTRFSARRAQAVFTVSEFSKTELLKYFGTPRGRVVVTPLACDEAPLRRIGAREAWRTLERYGISKPYFLFVGRLERKKNLAGILAAWRIYRESGFGDEVLVLAGKPGRGYEDAWSALDGSTSLATGGSDLAGDVILAGFVPDDDLPAFYSAASAFLFLSKYEGFGIPLLEAFAADVPVVASRAGSIPEVAGEAVMYAETPVEAAEAMRRLMREEPLRTRLMAEGRLRLEQYSWRATAEATWKTLREILEQN